MNYNYFRTYDPSTGRYLESDPIGLAAGLNTYTYVGNMPTMYVDPFGLEKLILLDPDALYVGDKILNIKALQFPDSPHKLLIIAHGNPKVVMDDRNGRILSRKELTPKDLADLLENEGYLDKELPIEIIGCETALGENSFAEQLSKLVNLEVTGYPQLTTMQDGKVIGLKKNPHKVIPATPITYGDDK